MVMLRRKTWRDIKENIGVYLACVIVIALGLLIYTSMSIAVESMDKAQQDFYSETNFADGFISVNGYPETMVRSLTGIPGIDEALGRIVKEVRLIDQKKDSNRYLKLVTLSNSDAPKINQISLLEGQLPQDNKPEIVVDPKFLAANHLSIGNSVDVSLDGNEVSFTITGTAQSPEFIYIMRNAQDLYPSPEEFGIAYVPLNTLKALVKEKGQVNDIVITLKPGASFDSIKESLQAELKPYGVRSIIPRKDQTSNTILTNEIKQIRNMTKTLPVVFLGVAAIILYTMLRRLIEQQRVIIGTLKAFGFTDREIVFHYLTYPILIGTTGGLLGGLLGIALSFPLTTMYREFFALPGLQSHFSLKYLFLSLAMALIFSVLSGIKGSMDILRLEPAQAMRPPAPGTAHKTLLEKVTWFWQILSSQAQMGIRDVFRTPVRSLFNVIGISVVFSLMTVSWSMQNMTDLLTVVQLEKVQTYDVKLQLAQPSSAQAVKFSVAHESGVSKVEPLLEVPATLKSGWLKKEVSLMGLSQDSTLYNILDKNNHRVEVPDHGVLLSEHLAKSLNVKVGDVIYAESPFRRETLSHKGENLVVQGIVPQYVGLNAFMKDTELQRFLRQGDISTSMLIKMDPAEVASMKQKYQNASNVSSIESVKDTGAKIKKMMDSFGFTVWVLAILGGICGFALIYNASIISLSERKRELASLRVLGMTPREVLRVITSEQWTIFVLGIILGIPLAYGLSISMAQSMSTDMYSLPADLPPMALLGAAAGTALSVLLAQGRAYFKIKSLPYVDILATRD
ncbi:ABC-type transport system, involved in lipoprotein release, permease component [Desulfosporosinus orientis DSM 765]|uniref:ABC-type transport system, involved in lipoprotein release, permease component n=1 Tax=Desulfosporosinus orientis (strain ATCC 19365 / DSM 765 / NCIMB 8382 / VKM B-1628 / Singapore I) TaxID=768706 RepID=G7WC04_DESOD|nr:ABC transporter permease [Desulfosporosinus orientis]AET69978.1 ABC-type transport system, involved in lipoprotein release, permease component [Desulfosporosinus orientis DSM 765]